MGLRHPSIFGRWQIFFGLHSPLNIGTGACSSPSASCSSLIFGRLCRIGSGSGKLNVMSANLISLFSSLRLCPDGPAVTARDCYLRDLRFLVGQLPLRKKTHTAKISFPHGFPGSNPGPGVS